MSFNWSENINVAWELFGKPKKPPSRDAKLRAAIINAYYAVYCTARNYLRDKENFVAAGTDHQAISDRFKADSSLKRQEIGKRLDFLRRERNKASYDDRVLNLEGIALYVIPLAEKAIKDIESL